LRELIENDLAVLLTERFESAASAAVSEESPRRRNNLPAWPTAFIGREKEVQAVRNVLGREDTRLVTLTGPGGVGKSRLGVRIAADVLDEFEDGVLFIPLAPIRDPALVTSTITQTLGVRESRGRPLLGSLKDYLGSKQMLLVLDSFEQVVLAAPFVAELLAECPRLKIIATSRATLHLRGEREFPVPPLTLPDAKQPLSLEERARTEAMRLFVQRAQDVKPDFALTAENAQAVTEICQRLDGLPLAIELAAARIKVLPPQALLARLNSRLKLLTGGAADLPARQRTLRNTIAWSYDLLDEGEKQLFRRLGVFAGGCTLEAVEAVCNGAGDPDRDILEGVASLVNESLVRQGQGLEDEPRFSMLETIREYALERLAESGEGAALQRRHADFFLALAEQIEPKLRSGEQEAGLKQLDAEHDNLRAVLAWSRSAASADEGEICLRLAGALSWFWYLRGHWSEGRGWLEGALVRTEAGAFPALRAKALLGVGMLATVQGDDAIALPKFQESTAQFRQMGDKRGLAYALAFLGIATTRQGDLPGARAALEESVTLFRDLGERWGLALALGFLAVALNALGSAEEAWSQAKESLTLFRELGDTWGLAVGLNNLASMALRREDDTAARAWLEESVAILREVGDRSIIGFPLIRLGDIARRQGDQERAAALYEDSLALHRDAGTKWGIATSLRNLGTMAEAQGDHRRAAALFEESLHLYRELGYRPGVAACLAGLAGIAPTEQPERAARLLGAAQALMDTTDVVIGPDDRVDVEHDLPTVRAQLGETSFAAAWAEGRAMTLEQAITYALKGTSPQG
jgi:predicted ATPase